MKGMVCKRFTSPLVQADTISCEAALSTAAGDTTKLDRRTRGLTVLVGTADNHRVARSPALPCRLLCATRLLLEAALGRQDSMVDTATHHLLAVYLAGAHHPCRFRDTQTANLPCPR